MRIRRHLSYANITATVALALALGGTGAYAATLITSSQIKNGTIQNADLHNNTIKSNKIHNGTIQPADLNVGTRTRAYTTSVSSIVPLSNTLYTPAQVATLTIPHAGDYVVFATLSLGNEDSTSSVQIACQLAQNPVGSGTDVKVVGLTVYNTDQAVGSMALQITQHFAANDTVRVLCSSNKSLGTAPNATDIVITATSVNVLATPGP